MTRNTYQIFFVLSPTHFSQRENPTAFFKSNILFFNDQSIMAVKEKSTEIYLQNLGIFHGTPTYSHDITIEIAESYVLRAPVST